MFWPWIVIFWILISTSTAFQCQSCFLGCRNFDDCDCDGDENSTCEAPFCYTKLEHFNENGISAIQKGCVNEMSSPFFGCQYASDDRSIACFCQGHFCNSATNLSRYEAPKLELVNCCECNDDESGTEICYPQNCTRNCTGNYCYLDLVANAQGCGWGHSQLFHFLRSDNHLRWSHELTCAEYYDNYRNYMSGCTCVGDFCNVIEDASELENRKRTQSEQRKRHFCYSLYAHSDSELSADIFQQASLCPSYFCFISWTSVEVVFDDDSDEEFGDMDRDIDRFGNQKIDYRLDDQDDPDSGKRTLPTLRSTYEISAGCLLVDDQEKVQIGCTIEWSQNENAPLTKHCVCSEKFCNSYHSIRNQNRTIFPGNSERNRTAHFLENSISTKYEIKITRMPVSTKDQKRPLAQRGTTSSPKMAKKWQSDQMIEEIARSFSKKAPPDQTSAAEAKKFLVFMHLLILFPFYIAL